MGPILVYIFIVIVVILVIRLFGSWMLRINELIDLQRETLEELKKLNKN